MPSGANDERRGVGAWVNAIDLAPGDLLITSSGDRAHVASVAYRTAADRAYNLTIANTHTYFVGDADDFVLTHNQKCSATRKKKESAEHIKGARPSTEGKHQKGQKRKGNDKRGGEKGDARRPY